MQTTPRASQFYTGLVAEVYDLLVARPTDAAFYAGLLAEERGPALELACGSGDPLLALVGQGFDVEGLDSSADMLARCRSRAKDLALDVTLHHHEMQHFALPTRYRTIFLAGPSFMLLEELAAAKAALRCIYDHLETGGRAVIPLYLPASLPEAKLAGVGWRAREPVQTPDGRTVRLSQRSDYDREAQLLRATLRYEVLANDGEAIDTLERPWLLRWYEQAEFQRMLLAAGFTEATAIRGNRKPSSPADPVFIFMARRS